MGLFGTTMRLFFSVILGVIGIGVVIIGLLTLIGTAAFAGAMPQWGEALILVVGLVMIGGAYFMGKGVW